MDNAQAGFIRNIFILDNVAITQEIIMETHFNKERILLMLDLEKAHHKVSWSLICSKLGISLRERLAGLKCF